MGEIRKRRPRDPESTREAILEAARTLLARSGPEALSLSEVAHLAGVNRGTAYQHFETREKLIEATAEWVSDRLFREVFGNPDTRDRGVDEVDIAQLTERIAIFAMANPELSRIWILQMLSLPEPEADPFFREYSRLQRLFAQSDLAEPGIDSDVVAIQVLAGAFLWPIWARSHAKDEAERVVLAKRFVRETLRKSMYGTLKAEKFPAIAAQLAEPPS